MNMNECNLALNASINKKEQPNSLYVHGSVMVYTRETEVELSKSKDQGINPTILLLNLTVTPKPGAMKGFPKSISYNDSGEQINSYTHVQVESNQGDDCTIEIEVFG